MPRAVLPILAFCVLFLCLAPGQSPAADPRVTLESSADWYVLGDTVSLTWTNDTDSTLAALNHPPYEIYRANTGEYVCQVLYPMEYYLGPRQAVRLGWDQRDCYWNQVPPGYYEARIYYVFNDHPPFFVVSDRFWLLAPSSTPAPPAEATTMSWGRIRLIYR